MTDKLKSQLLVVAVVSGIFYLGSKYLENSRNEEIEYIQKNYEVVNAVVTSIKVYKGRIVRYKYIVNGITYEGADGFELGTNIKKGDSLRVKYSIDNPKLSISEFNESW